MASIVGQDQVFDLLPEHLGLFALLGFVIFLAYAVRILCGQDGPANP